MDISSLLDGLKDKLKELNLDELAGAQKTGNVEIELKAGSNPDSLSNMLQRDPDPETALARQSRELGKNVNRGLEDAGTGISDKADDASDWFKSFSRNPIDNAAQDAGTTLKRGARDAMTTGGRFAEDLGDKAGDVYQDSPLLQGGAEKIKQLLQQSGLSAEELLGALKNRQ
ncbi:hypothetical protein [Ferrovibrio sp.]|uniref:hypothetical protein n=1 Tax=Ferrovibrio sp. TaxID=1917215 RepID=UPI000CC25DBF|nr:hypothetical protein [Ferrovibrio sp.]PJI40409.1 MAG: hypothetical protein CTR53_10385 [Ferrovibrio sp.]